MNILALESSCDETAAAVVADGRHMLSNVVASQVEEHQALRRRGARNRQPPPCRSRHRRH